MISLTTDCSDRAGQYHPLDPTNIYTRLENVGSALDSRFDDYVLILRALVWERAGGVNHMATPLDSTVIEQTDFYHHFLNATKTLRLN